MPKKNKPEDRQAELLELKKVLLEEQNRILKHLKKLQQESKSGMKDLGGDDADLASLEMAQSSTAKVGNRERKLLNKIQYTLEKFGEGNDTGTYGICELTGEDIPIARLQARPVAQYTVEAKEELERKEGGYRDIDEDDDGVVIADD